MFKSRKMNISLSTHRVVNKKNDKRSQSNKLQTSTRSSLTPLTFQKNKKTKWNEQILYAKSIILQITEQLQMKMLTYRSLYEKTKQIIKNIKRSNNEDKCFIIISIVSIYQQLNILFSQEYYQQIILMIGYLNRISQANQKKLYQLIIIKRIDIILLHIIKSYLQNQYEIKDRISQLLSKIIQKKDKLKKIMQVNQYQHLIKNIQQLKKKEIKTNQYQKEYKEKEIQKINGIGMNRESEESISNGSQQIDQKLNKLQKIQQNIQLLQNIYPYTRKNKKQIPKISAVRYNSININNCTKRVSCIWGQPQHRQTRQIQPLIFPQNPKIISGLRNGSMYRNSVPSIKKSQRIILDQMRQEVYCKKEEVEIKEEWFHPFYLYTVVKGIIRVNEICWADIVGNCVGLRIGIKGYFNYSLTTYRLQNNFYQQKTTEKLKKYLMTNLQLKKKNIWNILQIKNKIKNQKLEICSKNIISQLLFPQEQIVFYGFIKKNNVYFFTKYKSKNTYNKIGILTIYDPLFENILQSIQITNWKKKLPIIFKQEYQKNQSKYQNNNQGNNQCINIMETSVKSKNWEVKEVSKFKKNNDKRKQNKLVQKCYKRNNNQVYIVMQKQGKYTIISETKKNNEIVYSNLAFEFRFRNLFSIRSHTDISDTSFMNSNNNLDNTLSNILNKRIKLQKTSIINRRIGKPQYINIRYNKYFIKKIKNIGLIICQIYLFNNTQNQYILFQIYLPKYQRYYTFFIKPTIINKYIITNQLHNNLQEKLNYFVKLIKIKNNQYIYTINQQQLHLILQLGNVSIQGRELLYRSCQYNNKQKIYYIDSITFEKLTNPKICNEITIRRQIDKISKHLYNKYIEIINISNPNISKKYGKYSQFIKAIKGQLYGKLEDSVKIFNKNGMVYYYRLKLNRNYLIRKVDFRNKQQVISTYNMLLFKNYQQIYCENYISNDFIFNQLKGKSLTKYFGRIIKNPLIFQLYFNKVEKKN